MTHIVRALASLLPAILVLAGCAGPAPAPQICPACEECPACPAPPKPATATYRKVPFQAVPGWATAALGPGLKAFAMGCARIGAGSPLRRACDAVRPPGAADEASARAVIEANFDAWAIEAGDGSAEGMVTGYYEPVLQGSRTRTERFRQPVHGVPADLIAVDLESVQPELRGMRLRGRLAGNRLVPYWTRAEIESANPVNLARAPVLAWVEDPVELFFLQIQGSGQIVLGSGERLRLGYGEQNGHPYRSMGRFLVQRGELALEQASMQGIKAWGIANPQKLREALDANPSYVFFKEMPQGSAPGEGPVGTLGVPLTAEHSIAVDPRYVPLGAPVYLATTRPLSTQPLLRLVAAQDTGGAIRGAVRADFYWGSGDEAGALAGRMRQPGRLWILWPRGEGAPRP
jgi:membrane-bound lytic murein transglycosylase A